MSSKKRIGAPHIGIPLLFYRLRIGLDGVKNRVNGGDNVSQSRVTLQLGKLTKICQRVYDIPQLGTEVNVLPGVINDNLLV